MTTKYSKEAVDTAREYLLKTLQPGSTIYGTLKHVSRSGMYRVIDLYVMKDNQPVRISGFAARLLEGYDDKHEGCRASGCGMDMGFHLAMNLSYSLFYDYDCLIPEGKENDPGSWRLCPSPDHVNHGECRQNKHHHDGYALRFTWM